MKPLWQVVISVVALVAAIGSPHAESLTLERMTSTEVAAAIAGGKRIALVPIGGIEQTGSHVALGKHNRRAELLAEAIAQRLGNALVAPVVAYVPEGGIDPPSSHMRFAGTISIPSEAFVATLESIGASLARHGFADIVFLGDHGGYQADIARAVRRLDRRLAGTASRAHALPEYYRAASAGFDAILRERGHADAAIGRHGGLADTSLMLALDPSLVRGDRLGDKTAGVDGDATRASAALGRAGVELIVDRSVRAIRNAVDDRARAQYAPSDRTRTLPKRQP